VNIHIFRYADLLLLLAEAEVEAGALESARLIVNEIRARAGVAAQGCGFGARTEGLVALYPACDGDARMAVPINDPSILWADYEIGQYTPAMWTDQAFARTAVQYERRLELAMEIAEQVLNDYIADEQRRKVFLASAQTFEARHSLYPIPNDQIELSKVGGEETLKQNLGW
jgi:hypothetical protein